jgi:putative ABC transport system permease protein
MMHLSGNGQRLIRRLSIVTRDLWAFRANTSTGVPLAWRNMLADRRRFLRSTSGIMFAALLMLLQLGFRDAFLDSALQIIHKIDGDLFMTSATKFRFGRKDPFSRRQLYAARAVVGVESARPIYAEWTTSIWKNPQTHKTYNVQVLAFDPDRPVFLFPDVSEHLEELRYPDTVLSDTRARRFIGVVRAGMVTELSRREIRLVGAFSLGPDFTTDGTVIMSDRTFLKFFGSNAPAADELADVEFGIIKVRPGYKVEEVQHSLKQILPTSIAVRTRNQLLALETTFQNSVSPVGPIFMIGTAIGFIVGMMISYQIIYTELSDQLPQYATLKAVGYHNNYLISVVLKQANLYALCGYVPACAIAMVLYYVIGEVTLLPLHMTVGIACGTLLLTLAMCSVSAILAMRRVLLADPAELF